MLYQFKDPVEPWGLAPVQFEGVLIANGKPDLCIYFRSRGQRWQCAIAVELDHCHMATWACPIPDGAWVKKGRIPGTDFEASYMEPDDARQLIAQCLIEFNNSNVEKEIAILQSNTIRLEDHEAIVTLWKECASYAMNAYEYEHHLRLALEMRAKDAEAAVSRMVEDLLKRGETAEAIGAVMRYARDYTQLRTDTAYDGLVRAMAHFDALRKARDGRQT